MIISLYFCYDSVKKYWIHRLDCNSLVRNSTSTLSCMFYQDHSHWLWVQLITIVTGRCIGSAISLNLLKYYHQITNDTILMYNYLYIIRAFTRPFSIVSPSYSRLAYSFPFSPIFSQSSIARRMRSISGILVQVPSHCYKYWHLMIGVT